MSQMATTSAVAARRSSSRLVPRPPTPIMPSFGSLAANDTFIMLAACTWVAGEYEAAFVGDKPTAIADAAPACRKLRLDTSPGREVDSFCERVPAMVQTDLLP